MFCCNEDYIIDAKPKYPQLLHAAQDVFASSKKSRKDEFALHVLSVLGVYYRSNVKNSIQEFIREREGLGDTLGPRTFES